MSEARDESAIVSGSVSTNQIQVLDKAFYFSLSQYFT